MRRPGWRMTTALSAVVVIAAAGITAWHVHWPSQLFKSTAPARSAGQEFLLPRVGTTSVTPYQLGKDLYVNDVTAWQGLSASDRSALLTRLHKAEERFQLLRTHRFASPPQLTAEVVRRAQGSKPGSLTPPAHNSAVLTSWASTQPHTVTEDIGPTAVGDSPFSAGGAAYSGLTFAPFLGWVPCASDHTTSFGKPVQVCGGQVLASGTVSRPAGMAGLTVLAKGMAIGQAGLPLLASYTNHSAHAEKVTVTATVASVTMTLATTLIGTGCHESFLEYGTPARGSSPLGRLVPPLPEPPLINVDDCLDSVHFTAPIPSIRDLSKIFSHAQTAVTTVGDSLQTATNRAQLASAPSLKICAAARLAADISQLVTDLDPALAASLTCQPSALPTWTGNVPAGATVRFGVAPVARALSSQLGFEIAGLYSLAQLHVTSHCSGAACPVTTLPSSGACRSAATAPPGTAYVVGSLSDGSGTVTPVNLAAGTAGTPIPVGSNPGPIVIAPGGRTAYVTSVFDGVTPINLATDMAGTPIAVEGGAQGIAIAPDGKTAYVTTSNGRGIIPISLPSGRPGTLIATEDRPLLAIAITPDGKTAYVGSQYGHVIIPINLATATPGTPIPVGGSPHAIAITPDGKTVYVAGGAADVGGGGSYLTAITVATNTASKPIPLAGLPQAIAITPDCKTAYMILISGNGQPTLTPVTLPASTLGTRIPLRPGSFRMALSPDGKTAYVTNYTGTVTPVSLPAGTPGTPIRAGHGSYFIALTP